MRSRQKEEEEEDDEEEDDEDDDDDEPALLALVSKAILILPIGDTSGAAGTFWGLQDARTTHYGTHFSFQAW